MGQTQSLPRVSVVVPSYDGEMWVEQCLDALAAQTLPWIDFEVLYVENGPLTRTAEIAAAWLERHPGFPLRMLRSEGAGVSRARNLGLDEARAPYVTFVDDDDRTSPHMLEAMLNVAAPDAIGAVLVGYVTDGDYSRADFDHWYSNPLKRFRGREGTRTELREMLVPTWAKIVATAVARDVRFDDEIRKGQDVVFWVSVAARHRLRHVVADAGIEAAYLHNLRAGSLRQHGARPTWENNIAARVRLTAALAAIPIDDPEVAAIRDAHFRTVFRVDMKAYLRTHPGERARVLDAAREAGVPWIPWDVFNKDLARELVMIGALDQDAGDAADRLLARGVLTDVLTCGTPAAPVVLSRAEPVIDRHLTISGQAAVTWNLVEETVARARELTEQVELDRGAPYSALRSSSATPLEHLVAAVLKLRRPEWTWVAEVRPGPGGEGATAPVEDGPLARGLRDALTARGVEVGGLETLGELARAAVSALADEVVTPGGSTLAAAFAGGTTQVVPSTQAAGVTQAEHAIVPSAGPVPRVSVVVPTYRGDGWITGCLDALAAQTLAREDFEIVVVANGPRTRTPEIVEQWLRRQPGLRLQLIVTEQPGVTHARNLGLDAATGEYVTFVDDDDLVAPRMLSALLASARPGTIPMTPVGFFQADPGRASFDNWYTTPLRGHLGTSPSNASLYTALTMVCAKLAPTDLARRVRFREDLRLGEDRLFWLEVVAAERLQLEFAEWSPETAYLYRAVDRSASGRGAAKSWEQFAIAWLDAAAALLNLDTHRAESLELRQIAWGYMFGNFLRSYVQEHPTDGGRMARASAQRGLCAPEVPWRPMFSGLAREAAFLGAMPTHDAQGVDLASRLAASTERPVDLVGYQITGSTESVELRASAAGVPVDATIAASGPIELSWTEFGALATHVGTTLEKQEASREAPYAAARSVSAAPVDHLLAALFKLARPAAHWTAEIVQGDPRTPVLGASATVAGDRWFQLLGAGLLEAGFPVEEVPEQMVLFAEMVTLGLADRLVFDSEEHAEQVLNRCPVAEIAARARTVMTAAERTEAVA